MLVLLAVIFRRFLSRGMLEGARAQAERGVAGSMEGHAAMDMSVQRSGSFGRRLASPAGFTSVSHNFVMEWAAVLRDIVIGLLIAGAAAAWIPDQFWQSLFFTGHPLASRICGPVIGPRHAYTGDTGGPWNYPTCTKTHFLVPAAPLALPFFPPVAPSLPALFLSFPCPTRAPGASTCTFLRAALRAQGKEMPAREFLNRLSSEMKELKIDESFRARYINDGFSGGEKKRSEILQLAMLRPKLAILDETDSGLDVDALRTVADGVMRLCGPDMGVLVITHYPRILEHLHPDRVHVLHDGRVVTSGGADLARQIEREGYEPILGTAAAATA